jgi:hypothetical protein
MLSWNNVKKAQPTQIQNKAIPYLQLAKLYSFYMNPKSSYIKFTTIVHWQPKIKRVSG